MLEKPHEYRRLFCLPPLICACQCGNLTSVLEKKCLIVFMIKIIEMAELFDDTSTG